jgi:hypothetical protein
VLTRRFPTTEWTSICSIHGNPMFLLHNVVNPKEARTIERKKERERER